MNNKNILDIFNPSPLQQGILFHHLYEKEDPYVVQSEVSLAGSIDPECLKNGFARLIQRHDILRSVIVYKKLAMPRLVVQSAAATVFLSQDLRSMGQDQCESFIRRYREEDFRAGFNLTKGPLIRMALFQVADKAFRLLVTSHHIIMDGWSNAIFFEQLIRYASDVRDGKSSDVQRDSSFGAYLKWVDHQDKAKSSEYWKNRLAGLQQNGKIPYVRTRLQAAVPETAVFKLGADLYRELKALAHAWNITLNSVLQAAWAIVLGRYNDSQDVVFGTIVSGRPDHIPGMERSLGLYINAIPVRCTFAGSSFEKMAKALHEFFMESSPYHYSSLAQIQKDAGVDGALFDHLFVFQNFPLELRSNPDSEKDGVAIKEFKGYDNTNYPINIVVFEEGDLVFSIKYNAAAVDAGQVECLYSHIRCAIGQVVARPYIMADQIDILTDEERRKVLVDFNRTGKNWPLDSNVLDLFDAAVLHQPDQLAVVDGERRVSYRELDEMAAVVCEKLAFAACGKGTLVAILADNSVAYVCAMLGVLKCGAAFLPLEAKNPDARLEQILNQARAGILLTQYPERAFHTDRALLLIRLDDDLFFRKAGAVAKMPVRADDTAYVIFTSGSTGVPKGVPISHGALLNLCLWHRETFALGDQDRTTKYASPGFDASVWEIFPSLIAGATIHIVPETIRLDIEKLNHYFEENGITHSFLPTPVCEQFQKLENKSLRVLLTGGDTLRETAFQGRYRLFNNYGPTENAVVSTSCEIMNRAEEVSIGRPIANTQVYILDRNLSPCPVDVPGQMYLTGQGLSSGYLHDAPLTQAKFVQSPFGSPLLYASGDMACWNRDGSIRFLGRLDNQVKINGYRIECGEIERVVADLPGIASCKAQLVELMGKRSLWLFYEPQGGGEKPQSEHAISALLKQSLPAYMVPAHIRQLDRMPWTTNGKIDANALLALAEQEVRHRPVKPPMLLSERGKCLIEGIAKEVGIAPDQIGLEDDFFSMGGDSIRAMRLVQHLQKHLDLNIDVTDVFRNPMVADLLKLVQQQSTAESRPALLEKADDTKKYFPLSSEQLRLYFLNRLDRGTSYNVTNLFELSGGVDRDHLEKAFRALIHRHRVLKTVYHELDGEIFQTIVDDSRFHIEEIAWSDNFSRYARPFDLTREIPIRVSILGTDARRYLLLDIHHIAMDMASMGILMNDFRDICLGAALPPLQYQYVDYCVWKKRLDEKDRSAATDYWRGYLKSLPLLNFPGDFSRPALKSFAGDGLKSAWSMAESEQLLAYCRSHGLTPFMYLIGALGIALEKFSGDRDVVIGTPIDLRRHAQLAGVVGMFAGTLPIRLAIDPDQKLSRYFADTKNTVLDCFKYSDLPFEEMVALSGQHKDAGRNPLFDIMLVVRESMPPTARSERDILSPVSIGKKTSKFDMLIDVEITLTGINVEIEYCTGLYRPATIASFSEVFKRVCMEALRDAEQAPAGLDLVSQAEQDFQAYALNATKKDFGTHLLLQDLLSQSVADAADAAEAAIVDGERVYSLAQWEKRSNRIAHYLRAAGIGRHDLVGIRMGRSFEMMAAILGVLKAGAAYVPLDPEYPDLRTAALLRNAGVKALFVDAPLPAGIDFQGICADVRSACFEDMPEHAPERINQPQDRAVVIHTSGSTGVPKGVVIHHQMLINSLQSMQNDYPVDAGDAYLFKTNVVFDVSFTEIFSFLLQRARVVIMPSGEEKSPDRIRRCIQRHGITHINFVPSMLDVFLDDPGLHEADLASLKYVFVAGERFLPGTVSKLLKHGVRAAIVNIYGPSETFYTTQFRLEPDAAGAATGTIPIGKPFDNMQVYLLDARHRLVPRGAIGELCVSGVGVAKGYLDKSLEAGKFVDNPFVAGAIMYKTGDLGRLREDLNIEYYGRRDRQVKIAGRRVECSEIENVILKHAAAVQAIVKPCGSGAQELRLCAYVRMAPGANVHEIRACLADKLPQHMIPAYFVEVEEFPRTTSGKIDVQRLPEPDMAPRHQALKRPATAMEIKVHALWAQALDIDPDRIGADEDFFVLGGTSLGIIRMVALISRELDVNLEVEDLFKYRTIETVAALLEHSQEAAALSPVVRFGADGAPRVFCVPGINGHALGFKDLANAMSDYALACLEPINIRAQQLVPLDSMDSLCQGYLKALKRVQPNGPYRLVGHSSGGLVALQLARLLELQGDQVDGVGLLDSFATFLPESLSWVLAQMAGQALSAEYINYIFSNFEQYLRCDLGIGLQALGAMSESERAFHIATQLALHQITPGHDTEFVRRYLQLRKNHENAVMDYYRGRDRPRFGGRVCLFKASQLLPHQTPDARDDYGWQEFLPNRPEIMSVPGGHESLISIPHVSILGNLLRQWFELKTIVS